jgi:hypothetical protein
MLRILIGKSGGCQHKLNLHTNCHYAEIAVVNSDAFLAEWADYGTFLEERDLIAEFGDTYRAYQRQVPMLIPGWTWSQRNQA